MATSPDLTAFVSAAVDTEKRARLLGAYNHSTCDTSTPERASARASAAVAAATLIAVAGLDPDWAHTLINRAAQNELQADNLASRNRNERAAAVRELAAAARAELAGQHRPRLQTSPPPLKRPRRRGRGR